MFSRIGRRINNTARDAAYAAYSRTHRDPADRMQPNRPGSASRPVPAPRPAEPGQSSSNILSEAEVFEAFHQFSRRAVFDAVWDGLLTAEQADDLDPEIMFVAPALTLCRAALDARTADLGIPTGNSRRAYLTLASCPPPLRPLLQRWRALAPQIKQVEAQGNTEGLRRYLAGRDEGTCPAAVKKLAADINGIAIEITQRRTFQARFAGDVAGAMADLEAAQSSSAAPSQEGNPTPSAPPWNSHDHATLLALAPSTLPPGNQPSAPPMPLQGLAAQNDVLPESEELDQIRETLYAAVADELELHPELGALLQTDRARTIFGATALAMARVSEISATPQLIRMAGASAPLTLETCPDHDTFRRLFNLLTSRHEAIASLTESERLALRQQLLGTPGGASTARVLALASQLSIAATRVMGLPQHITRLEGALGVFGF